MLCPSAAWASSRYRSRRSRSLRTASQPYEVRERTTSTGSCTHHSTRTSTDSVPYAVGSPTLRVPDCSWSWTWKALS